jgi:hypothetical protein
MKQTDDPESSSDDSVVMQGTNQPGPFGSLDTTRTTKQNTKNIFYIT